VSEQTETAIFVAGQIILQDKSVQSWMTACSPDHPIRPGQHVGRNREADLLGGFQVDYELELPLSSFFSMRQNRLNN